MLESIDPDEEYYSECFFDYESEDKLENKIVGDPSIIGKHLKELKINPYGVVDIIKNNEKNLHIKETYTQSNNSLLVEKNEILNECNIDCDSLNIHAKGWSKNKYEAKLMAALKFLQELHPGMKWVDLEKKYMKKNQKSKK